MTLEARLRDDRGKQFGAGIDSFNRLYTLDSGLPPSGLDDEFIIFRDFLRDSSGSSNMVVNGAVTPVNFTISAIAARDRYIHSVLFEIVDVFLGGTDFNNFGAAPTLTTGCRFFYTLDGTEIDISPAVRSNYELIKVGAADSAFGDDTTAFRFPNAAGVGGTGEAIIGFINFSRVFGLPWGLRLRAGSRQALTVQIRDNLVAAGPDIFTADAFGFDRFVID